MTFSEHLDPSFFQQEDNIQAQKYITKSDLYGTESTVTCYTLENCLTPKECKEIIRCMNLMGYDIKYTGNRLCCRNVINDDKFANILFERVRSFLPQTHHFMDMDRPLYGLNPQFRAIKYKHFKSGHKFGKHIDFSNSDGFGRKSFYTFMIYLNDDFEGGETVFTKKGFEFTLKPKTGMAIIFEQDIKQLEHEGLPVTETSEKYILRLDVFYTSAY
ncbi:hypothetical protein FDP41_010403 [Naegleria fowleri]|uniref:Fe2OG dioxygenase domain-containing protein n=1 Tax=Naegleria fowleri TaxID=5763 RepID=A0A6A5CCS9_NAEFO|nr:uncharacterized protein FDP41_010403 [Naegleria fowleri]KAF0983338.1 hypothetical protein FDP41_010403 [Naegleria fowleri]CAG4718735.1 unnamed protein product [Naegleria fowleri]